MVRNRKTGVQQHDGISGSQQQDDMTIGVFRVERKTRGVFSRCRYPFLLMLFALPVCLLVWQMIHDRSRIVNTTTTPIVITDNTPVQEECFVWSHDNPSSSSNTKNDTSTATNTNNNVVGLVFREHGWTSHHHGHFHFFHFIEFIVMAWIEVQQQFRVGWVYVPHMLHDQVYGLELNRWMVQLVFGAHVQLYSYDVPPPQPPVSLDTTTTLSIERSRCTDFSVKKMWWKHMDRFSSADWYQTLQHNGSPSIIVPENKRDQRTIRIAYVDRQNTRRRLPHGLHRWLLHYLGNELPHQQFLAAIDIQLLHLHMEQLTAENQIRTMSQVDILIGLHGNGLSHQFFMPPHGALVEIFWDHPFVFDYSTAAIMMMEHAYLGVAWNGQILDNDRIRRLDPTLRTATTRSWFERGEWWWNRHAARVDATQQAIQQFLPVQVDRIRLQKQQQQQQQQNSTRTVSVE